MLLLVSFAPKPFKTNTFRCVTDGSHTLGNCVVLSRLSTPYFLSCSLPFLSVSLSLTASPYHPLSFSRKQVQVGVSSTHSHTHTHPDTLMPDSPAPPLPFTRTCGQSMQNISFCPRSCSVFNLRSKYRHMEVRVSLKPSTTRGNIQKTTVRTPSKKICPRVYLLKNNH